MNEVLKKLSDGVEDAGAFVRDLAETGMKSVNETLNGTRVFGALSASTAEALECDETHYVLVPLLGERHDYAIYSKRILPEGIGPTNSLPKARIFHLPDESGRVIMEQQLITDLVQDRAGDDVSESEFADTLESLAEQIDKETNRISGGLVLMGGVICLVNPLLGVGIAAKALLPSVGTKVAKAGAGYVGGKLRKWNKSSAFSKLQKESTKEVKKLQPVIFTNPIIRSLEAIARDPGTEFDPAFDHRNWVDQFEFPHFYIVTREAIDEVYREHLSSIDLKSFQSSHLSWIRSFSETK